MARSSKQRIRTALLWLACGAAVAGSAAAATIALRPGLWQFRTQIWIDGKEILEPLNRAADEIMARTRAGMSPAERAEFDRNAPQGASADVDTECLDASEARIEARAALAMAMRSVHDQPWACRFRDEQASSDGLSFRYDCSTAGGGKSEGRAVFRVPTPSTQLTTIEGLAHVVDGKGVPLRPSLVPVRLRSEGQWVGSVCTAEPQDDADAGASGEPTDDEESGAG